MFLTEHRLRRELAMDETEYVQCPVCKLSFQMVLGVDEEVTCKCPTCDIEFAVTLTDKIEMAA